MKRILTLALTLVLALSFALAADTSYQLVIQDDADLLQGDTAAVYDAMEPIAAEYANVMFCTTDEHTGQNVEKRAEELLKSQFGSGADAVIFYIDMDQRILTVYSIGDAQKAISNRTGRSITDNVYSLASRGDYSGCAVKAFDLVYDAFAGERITAPAQHITNALIALLLGFLIVYIYVVRSRMPKKKIDPSLYNANYDKKTTTAAVAAMAAVPAAVLIGSTFLRTSRVTKSSGSGGSGGGGGGGGGGSGGSHRF